MTSKKVIRSPSALAGTTATTTLETTETFSPPAARMQRRATSRNNLAESGRRDDNLTHDAASLAAILQIAGHVHADF